MIIKPGILFLLAPFLAAAATSPFNELFFEPNLGQAEHPGQAGSDIRFIAHASGANIAWTGEGLILQLKGDAGNPVRLRFPGASRTARFEALDESSSRSSYFIGADSSRWVQGVPHYRRLAWRNVYPGIDVIFYGRGGRLEYDFVVNAGADPSAIRMAVDASATLVPGPGGDMAIRTGKASFELKKPVIYQDLRDGHRLTIDGSYKVERNRVRFVLGSWDHHRPLVIDPVLNFVSYYGGEGDDAVTAVTAYGDIVGVTDSLSFEGNRAIGGKDIFAVYNVQGFYGLVAFFGGSGDDVPTCAIDTGSALIIGGWTNSKDFLRAAPLGGTDGFLLSVSTSSLYTLPVVTLIGGSGDDRVNAIVAPVYYSSVAWFAGQTNSPDMKLNGSALSTRLSGGMDALLGSAFIYPGSAYVESLAYFGGSGDDVANAVAVDSDQRVTIAGKTTSADLPVSRALSARLNGPSDAFIARFDSWPTGKQPSLDFGTYFGGSGNDEIKALVFPSFAASPGEPVYFAGVTSSQDLPLVNASQTKYGGGDADAFVGRMDISEEAQGSRLARPRRGPVRPEVKEGTTLVFSTYIGGSGHDEATALAGGAVVTGFTTSADLPVTNALQNHLAGAQDAFLAWLDPAGSLQSLSYFGGSGSEQGLALDVSSGNVATIGGSTTSPDLPAPAPNSNPGVYTAGQDGFTAAITLTNFSATSGGTVYWTAKGMVTAALVAVSSDIPATAQLTVTSADPSLVQVSLDPTVAGAASVSVPLTALQRPSPAYYLTGVADSGQTTVTISLDGFGSQQVQVRLGFPAIQVVGGFASTIYVGEQYNLQAEAGFLDDKGVFHYATPTSGSPPTTIALSLSDPTLGSLTVSQLTLPQNDYASLGSFTALAAGVETISATSSGLPLANPATVSFNILYPQFTLAGFTAANHLPHLVSLSSNIGPGNPSTETFTLTSDDVTRLCLFSGNACVGSITVPALNPAFIAQALADSGTAHIHYSNPRVGDGIATVTLVRPRIFLQSQPTVTAGRAVTVGVGYGATTSAYASDSLSVGFDPGLIVTSADTTIASIGTVTPQSFVVNGVATGQTTVSISAPGFDNPAPVQLKVNAPPGLPTAVFGSFGGLTRGSTLIMGKDLQAYLSLDLTPPSGGLATGTVTSSDPSLLLVSASNTTVGTQQASSTSGVYLQALAASGSATFTISAPGFTSTTYQVTLAPSGFAWSAGAIAVDAVSTTSIALGTYILDPATLVPLVFDYLRPGVTAAPALATSNPATGTFSYTASSTSVAFTPGAPGTTFLTVIQPAGFSAPFYRNKIEVVVNPATVTAQVPTFLGRDLEASFTPAYKQLKLPLTIGSADPSRLIVSGSATATGSAQLSTTTGLPVYLQALASAGTVAIRISGAGFADAVYPVTLAPAGVTIANGYSQPGTPLTLTTVSAPANFHAALFTAGPISTASSEVLRAGAPTLQVPIASSEPGVAQPSISALTFAPGGSNTAAFTINPVAPGNALIALNPPAAFHTDALHEQLAVQVTLPSFSTSAVSVARDFQLQGAVQSDGSALPTTIIVTITSNDPTRVLLSTRPDQPGLAQIAVPFSGLNPPSSSSAYYIQGIAEGQTTVTISGAGFADTMFNVAVTQPVLSISVPATAYFGQTTQVSIGFGQLLRPGVQLSTTLHSSDTTVATIDSPVTLNPGAYSVNANITPVAVGNTTISADLPPGYAASAQGLSFPMAVSLSRFPTNLSPSATFVIGKNLQFLLDFAETATTPLNVTMTSSDPSNLLLSTDPKVAGQASVSTTMNYLRDIQLYVQALADSGSATVTISSPGYNPLVVTFNLAPAAFEFFPASLSTNKTTPVVFSIQSDAIPPGGAPVGGQTLRGGMQPVTLSVAGSQPSVGTVSTPIVFNPGDNSVNVTFTPAASGTTNLTINQPAGFVSASTGELLVVTVQ
jgi:hypothetical protein